MTDCGPEPRAPIGNTEKEMTLFANALLYWGRGCEGKLKAVRDAQPMIAAPDGVPTS